jgi:hypothetical protein
MLTRLHKHFGPAGLIVAIVALVAALAGGAIAASGGSSDGGKATASAKAKTGPRGPKGPAGPAGAAGPAGPAGAKGDVGAPGANGVNGTNGANGASVTNTKLNPGNAHCEAGGAEFKAGPGTPSYACNGEEGPEGPAGPAGPAGPEGSPWVDGGTLPPGESETGTWALGMTPAAIFAVYVPISFPIPLAESVDVRYVNASGEEEKEEVLTPATVCLGSKTAPSAPPDTLCVYESNSSGASVAYENAENPEGGANHTAGKSGGILNFWTSEENASARGVWIVTAPTAP